MCCRVEKLNHENSDIVRCKSKTEEFQELEGIVKRVSINTEAESSNTTSQSSGNNSLAYININCFKKTIKYDF